MNIEIGAIHQCKTLTEISGINIYLSMYIDYIGNVFEKINLSKNQLSTNSWVKSAVTYIEYILKLITLNRQTLSRTEITPVTNWPNPLVPVLFALRQAITITRYPNAFASCASKINEICKTVFTKNLTILHPYVLDLLSALLMNDQIEASQLCQDEGLKVTLHILESWGGDLVNCDHYALFTMLQFIQSVSHVNLSILSPYTTQFFNVIIPLLKSHFDESYPERGEESGDSVKLPELKSIDADNNGFWEDYDPNNEEDVEDAEDIPDFQMDDYDRQTQYFYLILILDLCFQSNITDDYIEAFQDYLDFNSDYSSPNDKLNKDIPPQELLNEYLDILLRIIQTSTFSTKAIDTVLLGFTCEIIGKVNIGLAKKYNIIESSIKTLKTLINVLIQLDSNKKGYCGIILSICMSISMIILEIPTSSDATLRSNIIQCLTNVMIIVRDEQKDRISLGDSQVVAHVITRTISLTLRTGKVNDTAFAIVQQYSIPVLATLSFYADLLVNSDKKEEFFQTTNEKVFALMDSDEEMDDEALIQYYNSVRQYCLAAGNLLEGKTEHLLASTRSILDTDLYFFGSALIPLCGALMIAPFVKPYNIYNKRVDSTIEGIPPAPSTTDTTTTTAVPELPPSFMSNIAQYDDLYKDILSDTLTILKREKHNDMNDDEEEDKDYTETADIEDEAIIWTLQTIESLISCAEIRQLKCWKNYQKNLMEYLMTVIGNPIDYENETEIICEEICLLHNIYNNGNISSTDKSKIEESLRDACNAADEDEDEIRGTLLTEILNKIDNPSA